jgi:hypothetical protein
MRLPTLLNLLCFPSVDVTRDSLLGFLDYNKKNLNLRESSAISEREEERESL